MSTIIWKKLLKHSFLSNYLSVWSHIFSTYFNQKNSPQEVSPPVGGTSLNYFFPLCCCWVVLFVFLMGFSISVIFIEQMLGILDWSYNFLTSHSGTIPLLHLSTRSLIFFISSIVFLISKSSFSPIECFFFKVFRSCEIRYFLLKTILWGHKQ